MNGSRMKNSPVFAQKRLATYLNWKSRIARTTYIRQKWRHEIRTRNARCVNVQVRMFENKVNPGSTQVCVHTTLLQK